jgi:hypothetical protein
MLFTMAYSLKLTTTVIALFIAPIMTMGIMSDANAQQNSTGGLQNATGIADTTNNSGVPDAAVGGSSGTNSSIGGNTSDSSETISGNNGGEGNEDKFQ